MEKKTPLYPWHESHGGRIVPFASYLLPVQYESGVIAEHNAVREKAGLFDVSHMGEFAIAGKAALEALQKILTNDFTNMAIGRVRYSLMCNEQGCIIDDLVVCKMDEGRYMLVVNAANRDKDAAWIKTKLKEIKLDGASFEDVSDKFAQIALQGPLAPAILSSLSNTIPEKYYTLIERGSVAGIDCIVSRTGYTGETGFELYCKPDDAIALWEKIMQAGKNSGLIPCGLGARDTLRLEASMPLYGHEMDETITPFEAGLASAVKMNKDFFIGKEGLTGKEKPGRIRTGLKIIDRGIARENCPVSVNGKNVGKTTSGTFCPHLKAAMAMALLDTSIAAPGNIVDVDVRGRIIKAETCALPFSLI
ncbi:glycine cleavage system aminomethyltransferase GcvT [Leadbettera azotonutricia]|uniref:Aminomethyltransferase n=1 Tax=Leadbettera azotonutricia (strain ATCC BAA-888 / DSM 13862 / ZAS-9) TaxID=545695 RepID=F5YBS0_LEAAZ|nr:glycine cleavage system aminomethyltransferase GcvT [Leadbettera azotonutricia]AEF82614.1 aminomethyltransferase [Leadbettera azotonutricia ZAS-9]